MRRRATWTWAQLAGLLACGPGVPGSDDTGGGSTSAGTSTGNPTSGLAISSTGGTTGTTTGMASTSSEVGSSTGATDDGGMLILRPDLYPAMCNPFTQDCPEGYKCAPYADDGGGSWNNDKCVPVMENPAQVNEACFAVGGGTSGIDNCDRGLFCWEVDAEGDGYCIELCYGSAEGGYCKQPGYYCEIYSEATIPLCFPMCDPIEQDCDASDVCLGNPNGDGFLCILDASGDEGQAHDPCMFANACDPGLMCAEPSTAVECDPNATGCCEPFCDLSEPECPGVGQVCNPYFEEGTAPPEYENVGYCAVPE